MSVLTYIEASKGSFKKSALEIVSYGKELAQGQGRQLIVLTVGDANDQALSGLASYGADRVLHLGQEGQSPDVRRQAQIIASIASSRGAKVVVMAHNLGGKAYAPRVAVRLNAGFVSGVVGAPCVYDPLTVPKGIFSGKAFAKVQLHTDIAVLTLAPNSFGLKEVSGAGAIEHINVPGDVAASSIEVIEVNKLEGKILLTDAEIVVSGGRGMRGPDNWGPLEELAEILGAATACSRPVSDEGWRPHHEHVGQTGKVIAPNLYIAAGISGAIQHLAGVSGAKCLVAINKDPEAPVFQSADYGVLGDVQEVLPRLVESVKAFKANM